MSAPPTTEPVAANEAIEAAAEAFRFLALEVIIGLGILLVLFGIFAFAILRAGRLPHPSSLITALCLLTFLALVGFVLTEAESLVALASAGVGAIAGAVTSTFGDSGTIESRRGQPDPTGDS